MRTNTSEPYSLLLLAVLVLPQLVGAIKVVFIWANACKVPRLLRILYREGTHRDIHLFGDVYSLPISMDLKSVFDMEYVEIHWSEISQRYRILTSALPAKESDEDLVIHLSSTSTC